MRKDEASMASRIAARVRELRSRKRFSLDLLERASGVSRSTISLIERAKCSPTAVILEKLARGLGVALPTLFDLKDDHASTADPHLSRRKNRVAWTDPGTGYIRTNVSPPRVSQPVQIVEVEFPPGRRVAFE